MPFTSCNFEEYNHAISSYKVSVLLTCVPSYLGLCYYFLYNIMTHYEIDRRKKFDFVPKLQYIFFTCAFCRLFKLTDSIKFPFGTGEYFISETGEHILNIVSFIHLMFAYTYISNIWFEIMSGSVTSKKSYKTIRLSVRSISIILSIFQIFDTFYVKI